jgi:cellulose synthase/poly-beta-1,6-N-acetylglucosamine synthase-like glycosyltransferase
MPARLGEILLQSGCVKPRDLDTALGIQTRHEARLGDILIAHAFATPAAVRKALDTQINAELQNITATPPDPEVLHGVDPATCIRLQAMPWRRVGHTLIIAAADLTRYREIAAAFTGKISLVQAELAEIYSSIQAVFAPQLTRRAALFCPENYSCRALDLIPRKTGTAVAIGLGLGLALATPQATFILLFCWAMLSNIATGILRATALFAFLRPSKTSPPPPEITQLSTRQKQPRVSLLLPLFREEKVIPALLEALSALTYPKELLDVKFLLEEKDDITRSALARTTLPHWAHVLTVPADTLQTKPRAMNYALPFCTGSLIGIYDAEDRPDPDQIDKVAAHFMAAPARVAAVQCNLDFYNTEANWLSRCFTIEYAAWFRVIMRGMQRLGLPLPLGGTSVFMRRNALETLGGWDAHNVTEDADLGMRLARFGYRCEMVDSTTWEEANKVLVGWVKQRSRWIKGFIITWLTQMRTPRTLLNDLGPAGFVTLQVVLLGTATAFLLAPVFWAMWLGVFGVNWAFFGQMPPWFWQAAFAILLGGKAITLTIAGLAIKKKRTYRLLPFLLTMPLYWPLGTIAAYKALYEIFFAPFYWDKTTHGLD